MKKQRYNSFEYIHKAWRTLLYETAQLLQQTDFDNYDESEHVFSQIELVLRTFARHAQQEDKFILPAVQKVAPEIAQRIHSEHSKDEILTNRLEDEIEAFRYASNDELRNEIGNEINYLFVEFVAFNLMHMNMEEHVVNEVLWKHYTDEELVRINREILKSIPGKEKMFSLQWMIKAISNLQLIQLLGKLKLEMPESIYNSVIIKAQNSLPTERWHKVKQQLFDELEINSGQAY